MNRPAPDAARVRAMFDRIARRYNLMNRLMTAGQDQRWRRFVLSWAALPQGGRLLDLASGTGDIALLARHQDPTLQVTGADFSLEMMRIGQNQRGGEGICWLGADAMRLPFADESFDAVTSGYLVRNVADIPQTLREQLRVLRPGGRLIILESSPPPPSLLRPLIRLHLRLGIPLLARMVVGPRGAEAYRYLPESTRAFHSPQELAGLMRTAGAREVRWRSFLFGAMAVHGGIKRRG